MKLNLAVLLSLLLLLGTTGAAGAAQAYPIAAPFADYYARHQGPRVLGPPIGPPLDKAQYFEKGRLEDHRGEFEGAWAFAYGLLVPELIAARAAVPVAGGAALTYSDLAPLVGRETLRPAPTGSGGVTANPDGSVFVPFDPALRGTSGHVVPAVFWAYMNDAGLFPGGWLHDVGLPLSETFELDVPKGAEVRRVTFQVFERTILTHDPRNPADFRVERANTGLAYRDAFPERVAGAGEQQAGRPGDFDLALEHGGRTRSYSLYVPPGYTGQAPVPLVLVLHGMVGNARVMIAATNFNVEADEHNFVVAYPNGVLPPDGNVTSWNAGLCCGHAHEAGVDDTGFIRALVDNLQRAYRIDPDRIYATGFSNGGMMSYRLGCEMADTFAAIAPVAGAMTLPDCRPSRPVPAIVFHGTGEDVVPYAGGKNPVDPDPFPSVAEAAAFWARNNGCAPAPATDSGANFERRSYSGCRAGGDVVLYSLSGGGHVWPHGQGGADPSHAIAATPLIWDFFAAHPRR